MKYHSVEWITMLEISSVRVYYRGISENLDFSMDGLLASPKPGCSWLVGQGSQTEGGPVGIQL